MFEALIFDNYGYASCMADINLPVFQLPYPR
jgi:hypothetical protein